MFLSENRFFALVFGPLKNKGVHFDKFTGKAMFTNSILIGRILGIPIKVHNSLIIITLLLSLFAGQGFLAVLLLIVGIFGSVALHELGHSIVAQRKGSYINEIVLFPLGGVAKMSNIPKRPVDEIQIALAGPAVSLLLAVLFMNVPIIGQVNLSLFLFNLIPAFPMDGGRVLRALLTKTKGRLEATKIAAQMAQKIFIILVLVGIVVLRSFWSTVMMVAIGIYLYQAGQMEYRMVLMENQNTRFSGSREGHIDVEVSPPPYAESGKDWSTVKEQLRNLFRRR
jgi:Zn-dependent protease